MPDARQIFTRLFDHYGRQHWWPADSVFEVMVGAVLTQNTAWTNVERAIANLRDAGVLDAASIEALPVAQLAEHLRPSGYFNVKARRLQAYCRWYLEQGEWLALQSVDTDTLRQQLLSVHGVGPETADDILLYAFERPVFVIDAYTRRLFGRLGLAIDAMDYAGLQHWFHAGLEPDTGLFNEYHALIVIHAKQSCRKRPLCSGCCLAPICPSCDG